MPASEPLPFGPALRAEAARQKGLSLTRTARSCSHAPQLGWLSQLRERDEILASRMGKLGGNGQNAMFDPLSSEGCFGSESILGRIICKPRSNFGPSLLHGPNT